MKKQRIYMADDEADYRILVKYVFSQFLAQYNVALFKGGTALIDHLKSCDERPALIFLDVHMPELSGIQTLARIKQEPAWKTIPVLMVTNSAGPGELQSCYEAGANSCLPKPLDLREIHQLFDHVCSYWVNTNEPPAQPLRTD